MKIISYPIANLGLTNTVSALEVKNTPFEKTQFYIDGGNCKGYGNTREVLEKLINSGWLEVGNEEENDRRVAVLNSLSKYSMTTVALEHVKRGYPYLHHDDISMEFKLNNHCGLEMHYSVSYNDGFQPLFTLGCQLFLGQDFELDENKSRVFFKFEEKCSSELRRDVSRNSIMEKILDWLKELFTPNSYAAANTMPSSKSVSEIWAPPFEDLTNSEWKNEVLEREAKVKIKFDHPKNDYWEDDFPAQHAEINMDNIHHEGYMEGYTEGYTEGIKRESI
ncbi:TPA: hypothetical protein PXQ99_000866 [Yersinia enterocolitica]|nr:hypothetical protein [Yersinia enterocolitica]